MPSPDADVRVLFNRSVPMRDGVRLSADVYLPRQGDRHPVVLLRTPYNKEADATVETALAWARDGYAFAAVDVRGRGDSEGTFVPYRNDGQDGVDAIAWCAGEPWSTGRVGTVGGSYCGRIQWLTALLRPAGLFAMIPLVSPSDAFVEWPTGTRHPMDISWYASTDGHTMQNPGPVEWMRVYEHLPLATMDEAVGRQLANWREDLAHEGKDAYWAALDYQSRMDEIDVPALHISGWYDDEQVGTPLNYRLAREHMRSALSREAQRLLMGPWGHGVNRGRKFGERDFGPEAVIDLHGYERRFFDRHLKGMESAETDLPPVRIFVMGENAWRDEDTFPPTGATATPYFLHSGGRANSRFGDGLLATEPPSAKPADRYRSDPMDPVPFITEELHNQIGGADDYSAVERRDDVLVYTTAPLEHDVEVVGKVDATIYAATTGHDLDVMVKLLDVTPGGKPIRVVDGMVRGRFRHGLEKAEPVNPGEVMELSVDVWYTSLVFKKGHAIRIEVASSAFPKYDRNLQTGESLARGTRAEVAEVTVYHDPAHPSHISLPVVSRP